jgi:hypothetical protein
MNVLDPFEVADIEMWPFWDLGGKPSEEINNTLDRAECTVFRRLLETSSFQAVLNEKPVAPCPVIELPPSICARIVPEPVYARRKHSDIRIARRASTIAKLAQVISERDVSPGLRRTLLTQARRLEHLAAKRLRDIAPEYVNVADQPIFGLAAEEAGPYVPKSASEVGHSPLQTRTPRG